MTVTKIYMVRHAESVYVNGQEKTRGLSEKGQVDSLQLKDSFQGIDIDAVYSSDYLRAEMTVKPLADDYDLTICSMKELRERKLKPESKVLSYDDFLEVIKKSYDNTDFSLVGGESIRAVQTRAIPMIEMFLSKHMNKSIVIGTHGNIMTAIFNYYDKSYGYDFWQQTNMPDVYVLTFEDEVYSCINKF